MKRRGQKKERKPKKLLLVMVFILVIAGIAGGAVLKLGLSGTSDSGTMSNQEANRLITYLGINDYEYTDRLGSSFTAGAAKKLLQAAGISYDKVDISLEHLPGFLPLTRKQFESLYDSMVKALEIDRLRNLNLYIYDIDNTKDKEIDGIVYEVVSTSSGEYYMEKDYGLDKSYVGRVVRLYVSNNEIILCMGESRENVTISNAYYVSSKTEEEDILIYVNGGMHRFPVAKDAAFSREGEGRLCDVVVSNEGIKELIDHTKDLVTAKVTAYMDGVVSVEGYENPLILSEAFNIYKVNGAFKAMQSAGTLIGYNQLSLYIKDGILEAALITEDIYAKNIRVLIGNTDYSSYYHNEVNVTSDTDFTVTYGETVKEYAAGERISFRNGSEELQAGTAKITSKEEEGKITISSVGRQSGSPAYRGTLELSRDDKGVLVVNELSVEEYLYGVVPSEMPVSYEMEALKAQAICARAYAYRQMESETYSQYGAHLDDSINSQVYNNVSEDERGIFAVDDTYGVVPCYDNTVIEAFFFSTSCGATGNNSDVWGGNPEPYLLDTMETELNDIANLGNEETFQHFIDGELGTGFIEAEEPFFRWSVGFTKEHLTEAINSHLDERIQAMPDNLLAKNAQGSYEKKAINSIGDVVDIEITERGNSGIIKEMVITGTEETILVKGQTNARAILSPENVTIRKQDGSTVSGWKTLPSAYFYVDTTNGFSLRGGGFGHGVGMSQNGANDMAKLGYTAREIIEHYYTAVELKDMYEMMGK
ncbi:MAG: SpoIID/LytB domain-containing protein [Bacteroidales bacterium]|nr:SpoIID/LytB domain-containing protein [Clostridium sp.]MCM1204067.1 SpoIID/LytB domain-containing protein [Bacteroidales bacterium]